MEQSYRHLLIRAFIPFVKSNLHKCFHAKSLITAENIVTSPYEPINIPNVLFHEFVWENIYKWPNKTAIECSVVKRRYTFAQLRKYSNAFAGALLKRGVKPGEVLLVCLPNSPEYPIAVLGSIEAGIIVSTVNPIFTADELCHQLSNSGATCVVTFAENLSTVKNAVSKLKQTSRGKNSVKIISMQNLYGGSKECLPDVWSFEEMFQDDVDPSVLKSFPQRSVNDVVMLPYSSGTTGLPKGVCITHRNIVSSILMQSAKGVLMNKETEGGYQDILTSVMPFYHIFGMIIMYFGLRFGGKIITVPKFDPLHYIDVSKEYPCTIFYAVPSMVVYLNSHPGINKELFKNTRVLFCGGAPIGESDLKRILSLLPDDVIFKQGYGLTEASPVITLTDDTNKIISTVGTPVSLTKVKVIDPDSNRILKAMEKGEICMFGPQIMKGYHNNPEATASIIDKEGWLHTGDIGYYDTNGLFYVIDRAKDLIKVKGFQVSPAELEELLRFHPKVEDAAVLGVPDKRQGERPIAFVVKKARNNLVHEKELLDYIAGKVTKYKHLSEVIFTDSIPKNPSGKILKRLLREKHKHEIGCKK